jgi:hypothetical protein
LPGPKLFASSLVNLRENGNIRDSGDQGHCYSSSFLKNSIAYIPIIKATIHFLKDKGSKSSKVEPLFTR